MKLSDIATLRLINQQILDPRLLTVKDLVGWMGAMQAQDYAMAKWAVGLRLPGSTNKSVETAFNKGEILRTHLMRPTWHFVSADDIYWMLTLTAPQVKASTNSRERELGLTGDIFTKSNSIIESALIGGKQLIRDELVVELNRAGIATDENRASHLFARAELDGLVCSGAVQEGKQTYAILAERVPKTKALTREEALAKLAFKYFTSHAPANLQDFTWWSGLSASDARAGLDIVKDRLSSEVIGGQTYWLPRDLIAPQTEDAVFLLPAYDEYLISYRDRSASLPSGYFRKLVSENGLFRPAVLVNGQVIGLWKRTFKKDQVIVAFDFYEEPNPAVKEKIAQAAQRFADFLGKKLVLAF